MKYLKIITIIFIIPLIINCLGKEEKEEIRGTIFGTFYNDAGYYVVGDTVTGANGFEPKFFFQNSDTLKNVENKSRIYIFYRLIKERKEIGYDVECLDYKIVPTLNILNIEEDNQDQVGTDSHTLRNLSISHDFLNIITDIHCNKEENHDLWITKDAREQDPLKNDEITLRLNHKITSDEKDFYNTISFYVSVPIRDIKPELDSVSIRVIRIANNISDQSMTIPYVRKISE